jgi:ZIP family zinc transporter
MALLGPISGICGFYLLSDAPQYLDAIMLFGSGSILYSVFQDIAPQAKLEHHWGPPLGAVIGFAVGIFAAAM